MEAGSRVAEFWEALGDGRVKCRLCPHSCVILPGSKGICRVRENRDGNLYSLNYNLASALAIDPVEKKPLYHVNPGGLILSVGSFGCNFGCEFCQNWHLSQSCPDVTAVTAGQMVETALSKKDSYPNLMGIAYTYNEPTVWIEYVLETSAKAKEAGLLNALVTNGYISMAALKKVLPFIDTLNIDVKAWTDEFYRKIVHGRLKPVIEAVEESLKSAWVEVTYLVIPGENDRDEEVRGLARHLSGISPAVPLHLSRYFPNYRMGGEPTPLATLERLRDVAREDLHYVYIGNAPRKGYADTMCPACGATLLERGSLDLERSWLSPEVTCPRCGRPLEILGTVWV